jgi:hypothetical protein
MSILGLTGPFAGKVLAQDTFDVRAVTTGPEHHFFGYYGICPWNRSQTHLLGLQTTFQDRMPDASESASIGLIDTRTGEFEKVASTSSWNFQQGAMLHWNPGKPDSEIYYNDREGDQIVSRMMDVHTGHTRTLSRPINALSHSGRYALSLTYGRLGRMRQVVGYAGMKDPNENEPYPEDDGVFLTDLQTGESRLVVSIARVNALLQERGLDLRGAHMWFNHVVFNPSDSRFFFLARAWRPEHLPDLRNLATGMFTVDIDGSNLIEAIPFEYGVSHFDWRNDREILATFQDVDDDYRWKHFLFRDGERDYKILGDGDLNFDGHCTFAPDKSVFATDRKLSQNNNFRQHLYLYNLESGVRQKCADFDMLHSRYISGSLRCDFHPRWNQDSNKLCFDGISQKDGTRQLHVVSLS